MQLFKSHGLQEPPRPDVPSYRHSGFDPRYGRRNARALVGCAASNDSDGVLESRFEAGRTILRLMADYERAA